MSSITDIKLNIIKHLKSDSFFNGIDITEEFAGTPHRNPINKPIIFVGVDKVEVSPAGLGSYFGQLEHKNYSGGWANITLRLDCYTNQDEKNLSLHTIFEHLCQRMLHPEIGTKKIYSEPISSTKTTFSNHLVAKAEIYTCISTSEQLVKLENFIVKRSDLNE